MRIADLGADRQAAEVDPAASASFSTAMVLASLSQRSRDIGAEIDPGETGGEQHRDLRVGAVLRQRALRPASDADTSVGIPLRVFGEAEVEVRELGGDARPFRIVRVD